MPRRPTKGFCSMGVHRTWCPRFCSKVLTDPQHVFLVRAVVGEFSALCVVCCVGEKGHAQGYDAVCEN
jgi:hypothetical protein